MTDIYALISDGNNPLVYTYLPVVAVAQTQRTIALTFGQGQGTPWS